MDNFVQLVRHSKIAHPTQKTFKLDEWKSKYLSIANPSISDRNLFASGIWIYGHLSNIRKALDNVKFEIITKKDLLRYLIGHVNRTCTIVMRKPSSIKNNKLLFVEETIQMGTPENLAGPNLQPDEVLTGVIDAARFPIIHVLNSESTSSGIAPCSDKLLGMINELSALGIIYDNYHGLWMDCLWLNKYIKEEKDADIVSNIDKDSAINRAVSDYRRQSLLLQSVSNILNIWMNSLDPLVKVNLSSTPKVQINRGKKKTFNLKKHKYDPRNPPTTLVFRLQAQELYFRNLTEVKLPNYNDVTLEHLLTAWEVIHSLVSELFEVFPRNTGIKNIMQLKQYAPTVDKKQLISLISKALVVSNSIGKFIVDLFIYKPDPRNEIWFSPLIEISPGKLVPVIAACLAPNLMRNIEYWLRESGVDFSSKGEAFEKEVLHSVSNAISKSRRLKNIKVYQVEKNEFDEQIDLVIVLNNTILIGEGKCLVFPTEALDIYNYYEVLGQAVEQVKRKAKKVEDKIGKFLKIRNIERIVKKEKAVILPFVITNHAIGVGFPLEGIPIIDEFILLRYIDSGSFEMFVSYDEKGKVVSSKEVKFYSSEEEAERKVKEYLMSPPQVELFKKYVISDRNYFPLTDEDLPPTAVPLLTRVNQIIF